MTTAPATPDTVSPEYDDATFEFEYADRYEGLVGWTEVCLGYFDEGVGAFTWIDRKQDAAT